MAYSPEDVQIASTIVMPANNGQSIEIDVYPDGALGVAISDPSAFAAHTAVTDWGQLDDVINALIDIRDNL